MASCTAWIQSGGDVSSFRVSRRSDGFRTVSLPVGERKGYRLDETIRITNVTTQALAEPNLGSPGRNYYQEMDCWSEQLWRKREFHVQKHFRINTFKTTALYSSAKTSQSSDSVNKLPVLWGDIIFLMHLHPDTFNMTLNGNWKATEKLFYGSLKTWEAFLCLLLLLSPKAALSDVNNDSSFVGSELALRKVCPTPNKTQHPTVRFFTAIVKNCAETDVQKVFYTFGIFRTPCRKEYPVPIQGLQPDLSFWIFKLNGTLDADVSSTHT